jgi:small-conductance mechanosensitive channel
LSFALALAASFAVGAVLAAAITFLQRKLFLVRRLAFPLYVAALAAALWVFSLFGVGDLARVRSALSWSLLFLGIATLLRLLAILLFDVHLSGTKGLKLPPLLPAVSMFLVYTMAALVTLKVAYPKFDIGPLLATSAITSLVLGLALQPILGNFFAGLVISLERPFRINDWIRIGEHEGRVVAITWRTTHLRTRENDNIVVPNGRIADERVLNYYYPHPMHLEKVRVGADYRVPPHRVRRALLDCVAGVAGALEKPTPDVYLASFDDSAIVYELRVYIEDVAQSNRIASELRTRIWEEFHREGIAIPFPTRTLEIAPRARQGESAGAGTGAGETAGAAPAPRPGRLFVAEGPERGRVLALDGSPATVGRSRTCALTLSDGNASKEHLRIEWTGEGYRLTDLGSSFGTRVNGHPVESALLRPLDRIGIGDTVLIFESEPAPHGPAHR